MSRRAILSSLICIAVFNINLWAQPNPEPVTSHDAVRIVSYLKEFSDAQIKPAQRNGQKGLSIIFQGSDDMHYYAKSETAPAPNLQLKIIADSNDFKFDKTILPQWDIFKDLTEKNVEVYVGNFKAFLPIIEAFETALEHSSNVTVKITGIACTSQICLPPFEKTLITVVNFAEADSWEEISFKVPKQTHPPESVQSTAAPEVGRQAILHYGTGVYYLLAILAGISINIMPCVLPVIPLIMMRLIEQSKKSSSDRIASGMAFCAGVVLFFAAFALVSVVINISTGVVLDLNSLFRYPSAVIVLFLAIVFFGLVMLDVITLTLPSAIANKQGSGSGIAGSLGMGFFAGILSTPCSGALLGFVLVWAQTQPLFVSSTAIVLMGVGMALPYAVIVLVPKLLDKVPKPGHWMEIFKKTTGFLLFFIAVKITLAALPKERLLDVLIYGIVFSFCVWMWGKWVSFSTPAGKKWTVRLIALVIAIVIGVWLLPAKTLPLEASIDWQQYDVSFVQQAASSRQPVLLKFTADWCTNCKVLDKKVYQDPEVVSLVKKKNFLSIKADTTVIDYPATVDLKKVYGEAGNVPVTIIILPDGRQEKLRGIFDKQDLITILDQLPEAKI
ncbi:MAG: protein-disulfide reductase DsbD family protein [Planctomycetota bacterium]|jgi:thiol:disulfide interchange protein DsbD